MLYAILRSCFLQKYILSSVFINISLYEFLERSSGQVSLTAVTTSSATLTWQPVAGGISHYRVEVRGGINLTANHTDLTSDLSNLTAGTRHSIQVFPVKCGRTLNPQVATLYTSESHSTASFRFVYAKRSELLFISNIILHYERFHKTQISFAEPNKVTNLNVTKVTDTSVSLSWNKPSGHVDFYQVEVHGVTSLNTTEGSEVGGLTPGISHMFTVRSGLWNDSAWSEASHITAYTSGFISQSTENTVIWLWLNYDLYSVVSSSYNVKCKPVKPRLTRPVQPVTLWLWCFFFLCQNLPKCPTWVCLKIPRPLCCSAGCRLRGTSHISGCWPWMTVMCRCLETHTVWVLSGPMSHPSTELRNNLLCSFCVILRTNKQTGVKTTDRNPEPKLWLCLLLNRKLNETVVARQLNPTFQETRLSGLPSGARMTLSVAAIVSGSLEGDKVTIVNYTGNSLLFGSTADEHTLRPAVLKCPQSVLFDSCFSPWADFEPVLGGDATLPQGHLEPPCWQVLVFSPHAAAGRAGCGHDGRRDTAREAVWIPEGWSPVQSDRPQCEWTVPKSASGTLQIHPWVNFVLCSLRC